MTSDSKRPPRPSADTPESIPVDLLERYGARLVRFDRDAVVFDQGDPAGHFLQVATGRVQMVVTSERGRAFTQGYFDAGQSFGEPPLFSGTAYPASAVAVEESTVWKCPGAAFFRLLAEHADVHLAVTRSLARRLVYKSMMLAELAVEEAQHRLVALIRYFRVSSGAPADRAWRVPYTRQQLADMTGLRVETVIRTIRAMEEKGLLRIQAGRILWDPAREPELLDE